jgi:hypothetical protein
MTSGLLGFRFKVRLDVDRVDASTHDAEFRVRFPLGLTMNEHITIRPVDGETRVQFG